MAEEAGMDGGQAKLPQGFNDAMWVIFDLCYFTLVRMNPRDVVMSVEKQKEQAALQDGVNRVKQE